MNNQSRTIKCPSIVWLLLNGKKIRIFRCFSLFLNIIAVFVKRYFTDNTLSCNMLWFEFLLNWNTEFGALWVHQSYKANFMISLSVKTSTQRRKIPFIRYSLPWQRSKHTSLAGKKGIIDVHNISKNHFVRISWDKNINFLMSSIMQKYPDFLSYWIPIPFKFQLISP